MELVARGRIELPTRGFSVAYQVVSRSPPESHKHTEGSGFRDPFPVSPSKDLPATLPPTLPLISSSCGPSDASLDAAARESEANS